MQGQQPVDFRQPAERLAASESFIDRHAAMTIAGQKRDRLTKVMRQRAGTGRKTASSRDPLLIWRVSNCTNIWLPRRCRHDREALFTPRF